jgi:hypothetical protein
VVGARRVEGDQQDIRRPAIAPKREDCCGDLLY